MITSGCWDVRVNQCIAVMSYSASHLRTCIFFLINVQREDIYAGVLTCKPPSSLTVVSTNIGMGMSKDNVAMVSI